MSILINLFSFESKVNIVGKYFAKVQMQFINCTVALILPKYRLKVLIQIGT